MAAKALILKWDNSEPIEAHYFHVCSFPDPNFYNTSRIFDAFSRRENERLYLANKKGMKDVEGVRCSINFVQSYGIKNSSCVLAEALAKENKISVHHHKTLFEALDAVGYDYKTKKYVNKVRNKVSI